MSKKKTVAVKETSPVAKGKGFVNNATEKAKAAGTAIKAAGAKAASHVSRNRAAYIAGGLGVATGAAGMVAASRKRQSQDDG